MSKDKGGKREVKKPKQNKAKKSANLTVHEASSKPSDQK